MNKTRIIETEISSGVYKYHIEEMKEINSAFSFLGLSKKKSKFVRARFKVYENTVNRCHEEVFYNYSFDSISEAIRYEKIYLEFINANVIEYKGFKAHPIIIKNTYDTSVRYIDYKSRYYHNRHSYGYSFVGLENDFKTYIDKKLFVKSSRIIK